MAISAGASTFNTLFSRAKSAWPLALLLAFSGCKSSDKKTEGPEFQKSQINAGELKFSNLRSIGGEGETAQPRFFKEGIIFTGFHMPTHHHAQIYFNNLSKTESLRVTYSDGQAIGPIAAEEEIAYSSSTDEEKENPDLTKLSQNSHPDDEIENRLVRYQDFPGFEAYKRKGPNEIAQRLTRSLGYDFLEDFNAKKHRFLVTSRRGNKTELNILNENGAFIFKLAEWPSNWTPFARWNVDGTQVAFWDLPAAGAAQLVVRDVGTKKTRILFQAPQEVKGLSWSADGKRLMFSSPLSETGNWDLYWIDSEGKCLERITTDPLDDLDGTFSPDGLKIAFTSRRSGKSLVHLSDLLQDAPETCIPLSK